MKRIVLVFAVATVMTVFALPLPSHAAVNQHRSSGDGQDSFLMYGDSLTWESANFIQQRMGNEVYVHSFPASAPCQWVTWLDQDLATYHPKVVGIISAGNPCPGQTIGSLAYYFQYEGDLNTMFATATAAGAKVVFFDAPPMLDPARNIAVSEIPAMAQALAANYPAVTISTDVATALSSDGAYTPTMPCLASEGAAEGCLKHSITIRTTVGLQAGLHLCPAGLASDFPWPCPTYSSGEFRFAKAVVNGLRHA